MTRFADFTLHTATVLRWIVRCLGVLMVLFILTFIIGEGPPNVFRLTRHEQLYALGVAGLFLGLILAWFHDGWGGLLSISGWSMLCFLTGRPVWNIPFLIPAALGVLHLLCWWRLRT